MYTVWSFIPTADSGQLQDADGKVEREDWPREKLLVYHFLALLLGIRFFEAIVQVRLPNITHRTTSRMIPSLSLATAHKGTVKV